MSHDIRNEEDETWDSHGFGPSYDASLLPVYTPLDLSDNWISPVMCALRTTQNIRIAVLYNELKNYNDDRVKKVFSEYILKQGREWADQEKRDYEAADSIGSYNFMIQSRRAAACRLLGSMLAKVAKVAEVSELAFFIFFANFWRARSRLYQNEISQVNTSYAFEFFSTGL